MCDKWRYAYAGMKRPDPEAGRSHPTSPEGIEVQLAWRGARDGARGELILETNHGDIHCRFHPALPGHVGVVWAFGVRGGFEGPVNGLYPRLAEQLSEMRIASLEIAYRCPGRLIDSALDVLVGVAFLESIGRKSVILVGHSFGGAVAVTAGVNCDSVIGVAALSSQTAGAVCIHRLAPKPVLLVHGADDDVLPVDCVHRLYERAREPKQVIVYEGAGHALNECREALEQDLLTWVRAVAAAAAI